jgi:hypothetical protein
VDIEAELQSFNVAESLQSLLADVLSPLFVAALRHKLLECV